MRFVEGVTNVEYFRDVKPILERSCVACHTSKAEKPTSECEAAVDIVLTSKNGSNVEPDRHTPNNGLKVIKAEERDRPPEDKELKELLNDMNRRYRVMRERLEDESDTPDAA